MVKNKLILILIIAFCLFGCKEPNIHYCSYTFNNIKDATPENKARTIMVMANRLNALGLEHSIDAYQNNIILSISSHSTILDVASLNKVLTNKGKSSVSAYHRPEWLHHGHHQVSEPCS